MIYNCKEKNKIKKIQSRNISSEFYKQEDWLIVNSVKATTDKGSWMMALSRSSFLAQETIYHIILYVYYIHIILLYVTLYYNIICTTWTLKKQPEKKLDGNYTRMLHAVLNKPTLHKIAFT